MASVEVLTIMNMWTKVGKSVTDCVDGYEIYYLSRCRRLDLTGLILISYCHVSNNYSSLLLHIPFRLTTH